MRIKINHLISKALLTLGILAFAVVGAMAQTVSGKVTDESGEALIGVYITVKGGATGGTTDIDGNFSVTAASDATLIFSYVGYSSVEEAVNGRTTIDVTMKEGTDLDEVVVVGYGVQKKGEVTSSVVSVKSEDFNKGNVSDPMTLVQGKVAGLSIASPSGDPNGGTTIRLRGLSTLGANTSPLIVIDGVIGGDLQTVDPNDIEAIDVLKDGSAAAIYGSRASSGVIIITTKKGRAGQSVVNYNAFISTESIANRVSTTDAAGFRALRPNEDLGHNTDWLDLVTDNSMSHTHNISMSGGTASTSYRASFNYRDIQGVGIGTGQQRLNGRVSVNQKALNDRLTLDVSVSATDRKSQFGITEMFRYATLYNPTAPTHFDAAGDAANYKADLEERYGGYFQQENFDFFNPLAMLEQSQNVGEVKTLLITGKADFLIMEGLTWSNAVSSQRSSGFYGQYFNKQAYWRGRDTNGWAQRNNDESTNSLYESTLNYTTDLDGNISLGLLAGYSYQENTFQNLGVQAGGFISDDLSFNNIGSSAQLANGDGNVWSSKNSDKVVAFFGRVNVNYDDTYYLTASVRREGSSRLGANNKWGVFPAVSAGVNIAKLADIGGVDNLKLRLGYGLTGALPPESYLSFLAFGSDQSFWYDGGYVPAFGPSRNANPSLKWETKKEFNIGVDFALMDYALTGSVEFYNRTTNDLIFNAIVPVPPNQVDRTWANLQDVALINSGIEATLGYTLEAGDLTWQPNLVFSTYNTSLEVLTNVSADAQYLFFQSDDKTSFDPSSSPGAPGLNNNPTVAVIGNQDIGQIWGPVYEGISADGSEWMFRDLNGDGTTDADDDDIVDDADKQVIGNGLPNFSLGFGSNFTYGNFDFNFYFRGDFGHDLVNLYRVFYEPVGTGSRDIENVVQTKFFDENAKVTPQFSSHYVENASFFLLDNVSLGYTIDLPENSPFKSVRLYATGRNLFTITNYTGVSPEVRYADTGADNDINNVLAPGLDRRTNYFTTRQFAFGINASF